MPLEAAPARTDFPVSIDRIACRTALGNAKESVQSLLCGEVALKLETIYGEDGGEEVPLALRSPLHSSVPPRWWEDLKDFMTPLQADGWGSMRKPVFLTSSNFGIDGLYGLAKHRQHEFADWSTPHACSRFIRQHQSWGENIHILSHACVSAQLGLFQAAQWLAKDLADSVLVLSFDYVGPFVAAGFHSLKILNAEIPSPYQVRDNGSIGLGDGIAYAVLSKGGAGPRIRAQALFNEMYHFTSNEPDAAGFVQSLKSIKPALGSDRFWIKGHGTGTLEAGKMEAESVHAFFPGHALVSWKGSLGHTLGSCALVELAIALEAQKSGTIPGTVGTRGNCFSPDVAMDPISSLDDENILLLCNAFGGAHGAMVVGHA